MDAQKNSQGVIEQKWGRALEPAGFQAFPNLLLTQQRALGLSNMDLVILLHLNRMWWTREADPFPRPARIAAQMGVHRRSVERCLKGLEEKGLIKRPGPRKDASTGRVVWPISLRPLAAFLVSIADRWGKRSTHDAAKKASMPGSPAAGLTPPDDPAGSSPF